MDYKNITDKIKPEMDKAVSFFGRELSKIRSGRASISLVEDIMVDCFGQKLPLKQLASLSSPEPKQILISPWDKSYIDSISKAVEKSSIGTAPAVDGSVLRINLPPLSDDYRQTLIRELHLKAEEARKTVRHWRQIAWDDIQEKTRSGEVREDDKFKAKEDLQKLIDEYNGKIDDLTKKKEEEIKA